MPFRYALVTIARLRDIACSAHTYDPRYPSASDLSGYTDYYFECCYTSLHRQYVGIGPRPHSARQPD